MLLICMMLTNAEFLSFQSVIGSIVGDPHFYHSIELYIISHIFKDNMYMNLNIFIEVLKYAIILIG
jgi:hypothetical protein